VAKRKVPAQLKKHTFKAGSTKATKSGAKGGRKSPTTTTPAAANRSSTPAKPAAKKTGGKRHKK
jgi:hypothetical protein